MIDFNCPKCGEAMSAPDSLGGQGEKCPTCGNITIVPQLTTRSDPVPGPVTAPQAPPPPRAIVTPPGAVQKSTNGLGIASLVLGIIACLSCWIPFIGIVSIPLSGLGLLFGIIGLLIAVIGGKSDVGMPIAGTVVCFVALVIAIAVTTAATAAVTEGLGVPALRRDGPIRPSRPTKLTKRQIEEMLREDINREKNLQEAAERITKAIEKYGTGQWLREGELQNCVKNFKLHLAYLDNPDFDDPKHKLMYTDARRKLIKQVQGGYREAWIREQDRQWPGADEGWQMLMRVIPRDPEWDTPGYDKLQRNIMAHAAYARRYLRNR